VSKRTLILAVTGFAFSVAACGSYGTSVVEGNKPPAHVASVSLTVPISLITGQTARAVAVPKDASGATLPGRAVSWFTSSPAIASVNDSGLVSAVAPGSAILSAVSEGVSGQATIGVMPPTPTPIATVTVAVSPPSVLIGQTAHATATLKDSTGAPIVGRPITWQSSNSGIAAVGPTGDVTAIASGTAMISASSEGKSASSALSVSAPPPIPVASISVSPASVQEGATILFKAVTLDANNNVLSGRVVTWSSANPSKATVNSTSGLATGVDTGTTQITAMSEGKSGSAILTVTAPPPPPPPGSSNEPSGMTFIDQRAFNSLTENAAPHVPGWDTDVTLSIAQDATAPISPPSVLRASYPAGFPTGSAPGHAGFVHAGYKTLYIRFAVKLSSNWIGNGSGTNKLMYEWTQNPSNPAFFFSAHGTGSGPLLAQVNLQGIVVYPGGIGNLVPNLVPGAQIIRGRWQTLEAVMVGNSAGTADGTVDWWLDGVHIGSYRGIQWSTVATTFTTFDLRPIWGGVDSSQPITQTQTQDWDNVYLSGKN
jgi:uncharacterized protein YjdB